MTIWLVGGATALMFATAIAALAAGSAEVPRDIQSFSRTSRAERQFDRRASWLQAVGLLCFGLACVTGGIAGVILMR